MSTQTTASVLLGTGQLSWPRAERIDDRYGLVGVETNGVYSITAEDVPAGTYGRLEVLVMQSRKSSHIGDFCRGLFPGEPPAIGERIVLGTGTLFIEELHEKSVCHRYAGLTPDDGRQVDWLDPAALYRCHDQTVELWFVPQAGEK